jgi:putative Mn2+ efflux pump MntP
LSFETLPGVMLAGLGISTDEVAIGFPLGALRLPVVDVLLAIAIQTFVVAAGGIRIGAAIGEALGRRASHLAAILAGTAFVVLGAYLIAEQMFPQLRVFRMKT